MIRDNKKSRKKINCKKMKKGEKTKKLQNKINKKKLLEKDCWLMTNNFYEIPGFVEKRKAWKMKKSTKVDGNKGIDEDGEREISAKKKKD